MRRQWIRATSLLFGLLLAVFALGAIQRRDFHGSLMTSDGFVIGVRDGRVVWTLPRAVPRNTVDFRQDWYLGAPFLEHRPRARRADDPSAQWLTLEARDDGVRVVLDPKKTDAARWTIVVTETVRPKNPTRGSIDERRMLEGTHRISFKLAVFDGKHQGSYLALGEALKDAAGNTETAREVALTPNPENAILFHYTDSRYWIDHK